jgi:hypothetical protein
VREESPNGGANWWLIEVCPRLGDEGKAMGKGSFGWFLPFYRQRRERGYPSPTHRRQPADGSPERLDHGARRVPCARVVDRWASVSIFKTGASPVHTWAALFMGRPAKK